MHFNHHTLIRQLLDEYIEMYSSRNPSLAHRFSHDFSGYTLSSDTLIQSYDDWVKIILQDFAQIPGRIQIEMLDVCLQDLGDDAVVATAFFHIHLPAADALFARETARLVLVFRRETQDWKIAHSSMSIPFGLACEGEVYPLTGLKLHSQKLEELVEERTCALEALNNKLQALSNTDGLTGIANRRHFDAVLAKEWARSQRSGTPLSVIMLDVDVFKHFNDHYGHLAGDACLQALARTLAHTTGRRVGELAARFGGEEFIVLLPRTHAEEAMGIAAQIQDELRALALPHEGAPFGIVTVSLGVASTVPQRDETPDTLVQHADEALYLAKQSGRNCVKLANN